MTDESIFEWARQFTMSAEDDEKARELWRKLDDGMYYGLDGEHISMEEWAKLIEAKRTARSVDESGFSSPENDPTRIGSTRVGDKWVSTVWLGMDHNFGLGPPLIFETMVFPDDSMEELGCWRYSTREAALEGHNRVVICLENGWDLP